MFNADGNAAFHLCALVIGKPTKTDLCVREIGLHYQLPHSFGSN